MAFLVTVISALIDIAINLAAPALPGILAEAAIEVGAANLSAGTVGAAVDAGLSVTSTAVIGAGEVANAFGYTLVDLAGPAADFALSETSVVTPALRAAEIGGAVAQTVQTVKKHTRTEEDSDEEYE